MTNGRRAIVTVAVLLRVWVLGLLSQYNWQRGSRITSVTKHRTRFQRFVLGKSLLWIFGNVNVKLLSHIRLFATPWTISYQAPLSMGFSRQEYWSELTFPPPGGLPNPGIGSNPWLCVDRGILYHGVTLAAWFISIWRLFLDFSAAKTTTKWKKLTT